MKRLTDHGSRLSWTSGRGSWDSSEEKNWYWRTSKCLEALDLCISWFSWMEWPFCMEFGLLDWWEGYPDVIYAQLAFASRWSIATSKTIRKCAAAQIRKAAWRRTWSRSLFSCPSRSRCSTKFCQEPLLFDLRSFTCGRTGERSIQIQIQIRGGGGQGKARLG